MNVFTQSKFSFLNHSYIVKFLCGELVRIMMYKQVTYDEEAILKLYLDNEWYSYTKDKEKLYEGIKKSLDVFGAYDNELLVGLIRTIGDQNTIIYIQDILVLKKYQKQGIGTKLMNHILEKYQAVRQICLMTDSGPETTGFYESLGLIRYENANTVGFMVKK